MKTSKCELKVYDASAGSGKTYRLSEQFSDFLIEEYKNGRKDDAYRYVLAVTFTNKATFEMKSRIVDRLYERSIDENYPDRKEARELLQKLVHDYTMFQVSTIDRFFQRVLRAFAVEMGSRSAYETSLDDQTAIEAALDRVYSKVSEDGDVLEVLEKISSSRLDGDMSWDWRNSLLNICKKVLDPEYQPQKGAPFLKDKASDYENRLKVLEKDFVDKLISQYNSMIAASSKLHFDQLTINSKSKIVSLLSGKNNFLDITGHKVLDKCPKCIDDWISNPKQFLNKKNNPGDIIVVNSACGAYLREIKRLYDTYFEEYMTLKIVLSQIWETVLLDSLSLELDEYLATEQLTLLSKSPVILKDLIGENDTPVVYDRIGAIINHYLLDEFQDTSIDQWGNFQPLLKESLSRNESSFLVGDIKQSIYRWRNGDWKLLKNKVPEMPGYSPYPLNINRRSLENIVDFNNLLFSEYGDKPGYLVEAFKEKLDKETQDGKYSTTIKDIYKGSKQEFDKENKDFAQNDNTQIPKGVIHIVSCPPNRETYIKDRKQKEHNADSVISQKNFILWDLARKIKGLVSRKSPDLHYQYSDIAVLTSSKFQANYVANYLVKQGINVVSGESLKLDTNKLVMLLVELLKKLVNPKDRGLEVMMRLCDTKVANLDLLEANPFDKDSIYSKVKSCNTLYEICKLLLRKFFLKIAPGDFAFVNAFLDRVLDYSISNGTSIPDFLKWWDDNRDNLFIPEPNDGNAVRIMTMHKAKGLDFLVVFIPFVRDEITALKPGGLKWFKSPSPILNYGGPLLLPLKKELSYTVFKDDFNEELKEIAVDNLNLAYVSFTRPKERLYIYAPKVQSEDDKKTNTVSSVSAALNLFCPANSGEGKLFTAIEETLDKAKIKELDSTMEPEGKVAFSFTDYVIGNDNEPSYEFIKAEREREKAEKEKEKAEEETGKVKKVSKPVITTFNFNDTTVLTGESSNEAELRVQFEDEDILRGVLYHELFSYIDELGNTEGSLEVRVKNAVVKFLKKHSGSILGDDPNKLCEEILTMINGRRECKTWFDNSNEIRVEESIFSSEKTQRPDRLILSKGIMDWAQVVDYKFGSFNENTHKKYVNQVQNYMNLLKEMGYSNVKGWLWYVLEDRVEEVVGV